MIEFEFLPPRGLRFLAALKQLKMAPGIPSPLVVEFQTQSYFKIWSIVMEYIVSLGNLEGWKYKF